MSTDFQTIILGKEKDIILVSYRDRVSSSICRGVQVRTPANAEHSAEFSGHTISSTVPVEFITEEQKLPLEFIQNIPCGGKEFFMAQANLMYSSEIVQFPLPGIYSRHGETGPLTAALHMTLNKRGLHQYDLIIGGEEVTAQFPLHMFLNLEHRENGSDDAKVVMRFKPMALNFRPNKSMTDWVPILIIPGLYITKGATVDWDSKQVLVRYRL